MLYTKTNPTGIDVPIQKAQKLLHSTLNTDWNLDLNAYGRAYLLKRGDVVIPEVFVSDIDYKDVLSLDESRFFFIQDSISEKISNSWYETDVDIYFIINLKDVKPSVTHRADEEVHNDIDAILNRTPFDIKNIEIGITNVLKDFNLSDDDNFNFADFEPYHVFKMSCSVKYNLNTTKCNV